MITQEIYEIAYMINRSKEERIKMITNKLKELCKEQRNLCINEIQEENYIEDPLIFEQTEAIKSLVSHAPEPNYE